MSGLRIAAVVGAVLLTAVAIWRFRTGRPKRGVAASTGAVLLLVLAASGGIGVPSGDDAIDHAADTLGGWLYPFAIAMAFLETTIPPITLVFPGEWTLMLLGAVAGAGRADIVPLFLIGWLVSAAGDSVTFALGRRLGRPFLVRYGRRIGVTDARLDKVDGFFERYGPPTACFGRLLPLARPFGPFLAGASTLSYRRFLPWNVLGCLLFSCAFVLSGYAFYKSYDRVVEIAGRAGLTALLVLGAAVAIAVVVRRRRAALRAKVAEGPA